MIPPFLRNVKTFLKGGFIMQEIQIFNNPDFGEIRTVMIDGEPYFVGNDCAKALGYKNLYSGVSKNVDEEDRRLFPVGSTSGTQDTTIINESSLYSLIFGSKLDSAKKFKKWVTSEILPSIRKTGGYGVPQTITEQIQLLAQGNVELNKRVDDIRAEVEALKMDLPILPIEADKITEVVRKKGVAVLGGKWSNAYNNRGLRQKLYNNLYANLKYNFGVKSYKSIKRSQCDKAIEVIQRYEPPFFLAQQIESVNAQQTLDLEGGAAK